MPSKRPRSRSRSPRQIGRDSARSPHNLVVLPQSFNDPRFSDIVVVGPSGSRFFCHRVVLAASCDYFNSAFRSGWRESNEVELKLEQVETDAIVEIMLRSLYSGYSIESVNAREVGSLYRFADYLGAAELAQRCVTHMKSNCSSEHALRFYLSVADTPAEKGVQASCLTAMSQGFAELSRTEDFLHLDIRYLLKFAKGAPGEGPAVPEREMFDALMGWVSWNREAREQYLEELLCLVRFPTMTQADLSSLSHHAVASRANPLFKDLLLQAFAYRAGNVAGLDSYLYRPRALQEWNPNDKGDLLELQEGNLVVKSRRGCPLLVTSGVRAMVGFPIESTRMYWEVEVLNAREVQGMIVGLARAEAALSGSRWDCFQEHGWGICLDDGMAVHNGSFSAVVYGDWHLADGSRIGILSDHGSIYFYCCGSLLGKAFTGLTGRVFPVVYVHLRGQAIRAHFQAPCPG